MMATTRTIKPTSQAVPKRRMYAPVARVHAAKGAAALLTSIVAETLPEPRREDEFTLAEFMETAARMGRPTAKRTALESLGRRVEAGEYETRMVPVNGHFARVWRRKVKTKS